jgi:hypothetical protein
MKIITLIVSHYDYEDLLFQYEWHKVLCQEVKVIWNIYGKEDCLNGVIQLDNNISPQSHPKCYKTLAHIYASFVNDYIADYYVLMESDAFIIKKGFDEKCVEYMFNKKIDAMFPTVTDGIPMITQSSILGFVVISRQALEYYHHNKDITVWHEQDFVRCLAKNKFRVTPNPFIDCNVFKYLEDKKSLSIADIKKYRNTTGVVHPIKADQYQILNELKT